MSTFIPPTPPANKSAEQHEEPSEQDSFNHLLYKVLRLTSEQVQDLNDWMAHRGIPNVHEVIAQNFRKPHALEDNLKFITQGKTSYIQSNVMISLSLMISYIKHRQYSAKSKYFGPFYYIQIDPQDYDEWRTSPPEEEIHFQTPSKFGSATTPRSTVSSEASESYITLTNFKKGIKRDASAYPIFKNERYYNTFIRHFKATAKAQGLNSLMDPNFTPGSDEHEQQLFQEQQDFLYSVLISSLKTEFSEALVKDHERDAQLILELLHEHHRGNSQYSRAEINRITKYLTNTNLMIHGEEPMKVSSCITMINSASLTPWLIQVKNFLTMQESPFLSLQLNLFLTYDVSRSQIMSFKHSLDQQDPSHTGPILTC